MDENSDAQILARRMLEIFPRLSRLMVMRMNALTENEATLMQIGALHMLMSKGMTTSDLAKKRHVSLQAASTFVQGLVDRGWVVRVEDPDDRRRSILEVTTEGKVQEAELRNTMTNYMAHLFANFDAEEISAGQVFINGLNRLVQQYGVVEEVDAAIEE